MREYMCVIIRVLSTVLGKNAPNGYIEIHQSILNSYIIIIIIIVYWQQFIAYIFIYSTRAHIQNHSSNEK